jgi:hypothetical protein
LSGVVDERPRKAFLELKRPVIVEIHQILDRRSFSLEYLSATRILALATQSREALRSLRYIRTEISALESGYTQALAIISLVLGICLICSAHIKQNIKD